MAIRYAVYKDKEVEESHLISRTGRVHEESPMPE